ncbi:putative spermidine/putrescine transport system permease protein [Thermanaeromonas toyohensis ToBE]|uniref:Putative spermidine/putrescine transport system permease protein n=1 Tax=Thermanaeromonas toyohensis ToBE TaxID=698762 RepID=A0A1W1VXS0_9FIRM|nr:ABC transporter permease subunit [Thermanaeromonas toyohensis]SMB98182.1 putative spermidine/putrescine transport system permease protein [Thermanaeromonas toyohensis ToBE]
MRVTLQGLNLIEHIFLLPIGVFLGLFILFPLGNVLVRSFIDNNTGSLTLVNYYNILTSPQYLNAIKNSLLFSIATTLVGAVAGTFIAFVITKFPQRMKSIIMSLFSIPMTLSGLVVAFAFIVLLGRNGIFNIILKLLRLPGGWQFDLYTWVGLVVVYSFFEVPLMTLVMSAAMENLDVSLIEAGRSLGAKGWQLWRYIIIPVLLPGFLGGISILFAGMMGAFGTALALTGMEKNLLSLQIYSHTSESNFNIPQADALAVVLAIFIAVILILISSLERRLQPGRGKS